MKDAAAPGLHDVADDSGGIAIVGMACRLPGAPNVAAFWKLLCEGREGLTHFSTEELRAAGVPSAVLADPCYVRTHGVLRDIETFDAKFFGMTPREASITDPQHRIMLELAWEALESSGHEPLTSPQPIGVYASCGASSYLMHNLWPNWSELSDVGELRARLGTGQEYLATRISYKLNLVGPSLSVNTACSSSLVAVHLACDALTSFQCDAALAGGISIQLPQARGYRYDPGGILSPDGHCRAFDAAAQGTVSGNGGALVVLKRVADAIADANTIYAVIRGTAINNDGADKAGFTAPSQAAQRRVIEEAQQVAGIDPATIGYVEAHGTGTPIGDPIEFAALVEAFRARTQRRSFCGLGSIKTNFGHLDEGAGVAGLIKAALCLRHGLVPPSLHFRDPNPELAYADSPFVVADSLQAWAAPPDGTPRRAAVSSFGIGGTNAHAVLEEAPPRQPSPARRPVHILPVSAATEAACTARQRELGACLAAPDAPALADAATTLQIGRRAFAHRAFALASNPAEASVGLSAAKPISTPGAAPPVVFMLAGQGATSLRMAADLYELEPCFRDVFDLCARMLLPTIRLDIRTFVLSDDAATTAASLLQTRFAQPALFALNYALARLWMEWGVRPAALVGHSLGEYVALCLAEILPLDAALSVVAERGALMQDAPAGAMLAVPLGPTALRNELAAEVDITAVNASDRCTVGGPALAVEAFARILRARGVETVKLPVLQAFHTRAMEAPAAALRSFVARYRPSPQRIPTISNVTGTWLTDDEAADPAYYARHLRQPVLFSDGIQCLVRDLPGAVFLEVGPGTSLAQMARRCGADLCLSSLPSVAGEVPSHRTLLASLGRLWQAGVVVDWQAFAEPGCRRVALPSYPFARERHWVDAPQAPQATRERTAASMSDSRWCYRPVWTQTSPPPPSAPSGSWLLLGNDDACAPVAEQLRRQGCHVTTSARTDEFEAVLTAMPRPPEQVVWLWSHGPAASWRAEGWCVALLALLQALDAAAPGARLALATSGIRAGAGGLDIEKGTLPGLVRSAAQEYPDRAIRLIDLSADALRGQPGIEALLSFCGAPIVDDLQAWRDGMFWKPDCVPAVEAETAGIALRRQGTYVVTGGLGGIGLSLADALTRDWDARIVLLGRTPPPPRDTWARLLADPDTAEPLRHQLRILTAMEARGSSVLVQGCDVADPKSLASAIAAAKARFGDLHGVIHAAGVADGAMLALRDAADIEAVLAPKVAGLRALTEALAEERLDFLLACSALSAETGAPGQAAYCAANSYLDLCAEASRAPWPILSVAWDAWRDVGMATRTISQRARGRLTRVRSHRDGSAVFVIFLSGTDDWVLSEHRIGEHAVLPGTAYLDLAWMALHELTGARAVHFRDVALVQALALKPGAEAELEVALERDGGAFHFAITTGKGADPCTHAHGWIAARPLSATTPASRGDSGHVEADPAFAGRLLAFGPHWHCAVGFPEAKRDVADIALPNAYADEIEGHMLHPALFDVAIGFAVLDQHYDAALLPSGYRSLQAFCPLPARVRSRVIAARTTPEGLDLDLELHDAVGNPLVSVEGYTLRRTSAQIDASASNETGLGTPENQAEAGLSPAVGAALFAHALRLGGPRIIVSIRDPAEWRRLRLSAAAQADAEMGGQAEHDVASQLAAILGKLLGHPEIDRNVDFFSIGGDSLIGAQFVAQASRRLRIPLTLRDLLESPTITGLTAIAATRRGSTGHAIVPTPLQAYYPMSHAQQRLWIIAHDPTAAIAYNMSYALSLKGALDIPALERAFDAIVQRHESLRTAFVTVAGIPCTEVRSVARLELPVRDLSEERDPELLAAEIIRGEAAALIPLDRPPLLRVRLVRRSPREHILLVTLAHIVADGVSLNVLIDDLERSYAALSAGEEPALPVLPIQFKDFAVWERQQSASEARLANQRYWLELLGDDLPVLHLPIDHPRATKLDFCGGQVLVRLSGPAFEQLRSACRQHSVTLFMMLTAAVLVVLHEMSGDEDILLGTPVAGRERPELQGQIGYYLNNVVLRCVLERRETFAELLARVCKTVMQALAHQDYPFDLLIEELGIEVEPGRSPVFDVQINLMPGETRQLRLGDITVGSFESDGGTALFDLNFMFSEEPEELVLGLCYRTSLFDVSTIEQVGDRLIRILHEVGADQTKTVRWLCEQIGCTVDLHECAAFRTAALNLDEEF